MWAQSWVNIYNLVEPYPGKESIDITPVLKEKVREKLKINLFILAKFHCKFHKTFCRYG